MNQDEKMEIIEQFTELEFVPENTDIAIRNSDVMKIPFAEISALGSSFSSFFSTLKSTADVNPNTSEILYRAVTKDGVPVRLPFLCKEGAPGFSAGIRGQNGLSIARFQEVKQVANTNKVSNVSNVANSASTGFMAIALIQINHKLDEIKETQTQIIDILLDDKKSQQRGDFNYLSELLHNYKYNWNDLSYRNNTYSKVEDVKRTAMQNIPFYKTRISTLLNDTNFINTHKSFNEKMNHLNQMFEEYRIASYLYAYASFVGTVILGNFESEYIDKLHTRITNASQEYRELYTQAYNLLEHELDSTIGNFVLGSVSNITKAAGTGLSKIPVLNKSPLDDNVINASTNIKTFCENKSDETMSRFVNNHSNHTQIFTDGLETLGRLYNNDTEILFDRKNIYLVS